jgi:hypothetical protein
VTETQYTAKLKERFRKKGWHVKKNSDRYFSGWPDLTLTMPNRVLQIEVKVNKNPLSPLQELCIKDLNKAGQQTMAIVMRRSDDGEEVIYTLDHKGIASNVKEDFNFLLEE